MRADNDVLREQVQYQLAALRDLLDVWMRRAPFGVISIVRVGDARYY
jgi:hypothetical protein